MALANLLAVEEKLEKELTAKRMIGPFTEPAFPVYVISILGLRAMKAPGKFRVIHNLSAPFEGLSVNSCIPKADGTVSYNTVDTAIRLIQEVGQGPSWPRRTLNMLTSSFVSTQMMSQPWVSDGSNTGCGMPPFPWGPGQAVPYSRPFLRLYSTWPNGRIVVTCAMF